MAQYELNLHDYLRIIRRRKFIITASIIIFSVTAFFYVSVQVPVFEARTTVKVEERKTVGGMLSDWVSYNRGDVIETQTKVIKGFKVMKKAAQRLELIDATTPAAKVYKVVGRLSSKIKTERIGFTNLIAIVATANDPEEAMAVAKNVAEAYIEENLLGKSQEARSSRKFIEGQLALLEERLAQAEDKLKGFDQEVKDIHIAESVQKQLTDLEFQLASLLQKYTKRHPRVIQLEEQIKELEKRLQGFSGIELDYARAQREVEVNQKLYTMLREKLEEVRIAEAEKVPDITVIDPALIPAGAVNDQSNFSVFFGGLLGLVIGMILAIVAETMDTSIGTIEDVENIIKLPVLGVVPSVHSELPQEKAVFGRLRRRLFGFWRRKDQDDSYVRLIVFHRPDSSVAESFRNIRTSLRLGEQKRAILVTSANPREGKTSLLVNVGLTIAQEGQRTLLVSSDMRRPTLARTFGISRSPGLAEVLTGVVDVDSAIRGLSDFMLGDMNFDDLVLSPAMKNIWILPSGSLPSYPAELLGSKDMATLIEELKGKFDLVLFDTPPVLVVADASILAPYMDSIVLCYEIGRTARHALLRAKTQLEAVEGKLAGVVLNHINPQTEVFKTYPYYYKYSYHKIEGT